MASSNPTTGLNTAARVRITSTAPTLTLSPTNTGQLLTYQITAEVTDVAGNVLDPQPQLYYNVIAGFDLATISDTGLVTAEAPGQVVVQVSAAAFGAVPGAFTPEGIPQTGIVYAEQTVKVTEGQVVPDFFFVLTSPSAGNYTITQSPETNSTWDETVTYTLGPTNANPTVLGTITGSGTLSFSHGSQNFVLQGTCAGSGTFHVIYTSSNSGPMISDPQFQFPCFSIRGKFSDSGTNSGQPYIPA
jgi:hypothetical protein